MLKVHLYGGLLCFWYLIIFAVSSLFYHHHFSFMQPQQIPYGNETMALALPTIESDSALASTLVDTLEIAGWHLPWRTTRDSAGVFTTEVENPKMHYDIVYNTATGALEVSKQFKGFWNIINALHGLGRIPNAPLMIVWEMYGYACLGVVLFSIVSGIWLWARKPGMRKPAWLLFTLAAAGSLLFMGYIYYNG